MAENVYLVAAGFIQKFKDKDAITVRDTNGGKVVSFTIKALGTQKLVRISAFASDFAEFSPAQDDFVVAEGKYEASGDNNQYHNITAYKLNVNGQKITRKEREVVNSGGGDSSNSQSSSSASTGDTNPF